MSSEDILADENKMSDNEMNDNKSNEMNDNKSNDMNDNVSNDMNDNVSNDMNDNKSNEMNDNKSDKIDGHSHGSHKQVSIHLNTRRGHGKIGIIVIIVLIVFMVGITLYPYGHDTEDNVARIAVLAPLSGHMSELGIEYARGVVIAENDLNAEFRPFGKKYLVDVFDSGGNEAIALDTFVDLYNKDYKVVIGPITSNDFLVVSRYADLLEMVLVSPSATTSDLTKGYDYVFRTVPPDRYLVYGLSSIIASDESLENIMMVYSDSNYGSGIEESLRNELKKYHRDLEAIDILDRDKDVNMSAIAQKIHSAQPDVVVIALSYPSQFVELLEETSKLNTYPHWIVTDTVISSEVANLGKLSDGVIGIATSKRMSKGSYRKSYEKMFRSNMEIYDSVYGYDTMKMLASVIDSRGYDAKAIRDGIKECRYVGLTGAIVLDEEGDRYPSYDVVQLQNGSWVTLSWDELMDFEVGGKHE